jgi:hypothetical protein
MAGVVSENNMAEYNALQAGTLSPEDYAQQQAINRNQRFAELLAQQTQQPQGQMISGRYVPPSFFQMLNPAVNAVTSAYIGKSADTDAAKLAEIIRGKKQAAIERYANATNPIERFQAGTSDYAPSELQKTAYGMVGPQKVGEGEVINQLNMQTGKYEPIAQGNEKVHAVKGNLVTSSGKVLYSAPLTGEEKANPQEGPLRTTFLGQAQPHVQVASAYRKIVAAPDTAAGDMSKIFGFMKILDPSSTVREGEYASAENARGVPDSVRAQYNKVMSGQRLSPVQRTQFNQAAGDLISSQKEQFEGQKQYFSDVAKHLKIAPENIIYDPYAGLELQTTPPKQPKQPVNAAQQLSIPSAKSNIINQADAIISGGK